MCRYEIPFVKEKIKIVAMQQMYNIVNNSFKIVLDLFKNIIFIYYIT